VRLPLGRPRSPLAKPDTITALNLRWDRPVGGFGKSDVDVFRQRILSEVLAKRPDRTAPFFVFRTHARAEMAACFPRLKISRYDSGSALARFLPAVRVLHGVTLAFDLRKTSDIRRISLKPRTICAKRTNSVSSSIIWPLRPCPSKRTFSFQLYLS
jgi:hypothetical protein